MTHPQDGPGRKTVVRKSITIGRSAEEVSRAFTDVALLSRLVDNLESAKEKSPDGWHWLSSVVSGRAGRGQARVLDEQPGRLLRWRWDEDGEERGEGIVTFQPAPGDRGTEVAVELAYDAGGAARRWVEKMLGTEAGQQLLRDLYRLRQLLETGEIATTVGQPAARETTGGVLVSAMGQPSGRAEQ